MVSVKRFFLLLLVVLVSAPFLQAGKKKKQLESAGEPAQATLPQVIATGETAVADESEVLKAAILQAADASVVAATQAAEQAALEQEAEELDKALGDELEELLEQADKAAAIAVKEKWIKDNGHLISEAGLYFALDKLLAKDAALRAKYSETLRGMISQRRDGFFGPASQKSEDWGAEVWRGWKRRKAKAFGKRLLGSAKQKKQKGPGCKDDLVGLLDELSAQEKQDDRLLYRIFRKATVGVAQNWRLILGIACILLVKRLCKEFCPEGAALGQLQAEIESKPGIEWGKVMRLVGAQDIWGEVKCAATCAWRKMVGE